MMTMSMANGSDLIVLPTGFIFRPTDLELLVGYLQRKNLNLPLPCNVIKEIEFYSYHPSEIAQLGEGDDKFYYFTPTKPKYPNGVQPIRVAMNGGWKATGSKPVCDSTNNEVGTKKSLVFIDSEGQKTNWHMLEYRTDAQRENNDNDSRKSNKWTLCCIYEKINAEEKKRAKDMAVAASSSHVNIVSTSSSQGVANRKEPANAHDHDQSQPRKRQKCDVVSKDEEISPADNINEWNREENETLYEGLPNIVDLEPFDRMNDFDPLEF